MPLEDLINSWEKDSNIDETDPGKELLLRSDGFADDARPGPLPGCAEVPGRPAGDHGPRQRLPDGR